MLLRLSFFFFFFDLPYNLLGLRVFYRIHLVFVGLFFLEFYSLILFEAAFDVRPPFIVCYSLFHLSHLAGRIDRWTDK
jgi:hypothetical protein